jgi:hypothetical protein
MEVSVGVEHVALVQEELEELVREVVVAFNSDAGNPEGLRLFQEREAGSDKQ